MDAPESVARESSTESGQSIERGDVAGDGHITRAPRLFPLVEIPLVETKSPDKLTVGLRSRRPHKTPSADLRRQYRLTLELSFVVVLGILVGLTYAGVRFGGGIDVPVIEAQEVVQMQEIQQTKQIERPPAPPRPAPPVEVPNDEIIEDEVLNLDASLDLNEALDVSGGPPPPPPTEEKEEPEDEIFIAVEEDPVLIGGLASLQSKIQYPEMARKAGIEGRVIVQFVVNENGNVVDPVVLSAPHKLLATEALRVIRLAKFKPGRQRNRTVKVRMAMPITFRMRR